jgi:hypothetical protein
MGSWRFLLLAILLLAGAVYLAIDPPAGARPRYYMECRP